jgi:N-[(2S)-2-amino-2-carboxyethyl]-L-glutamate dehydrogenase
VTDRAEDVVRVGDLVVPCTVTETPYIPFRWLDLY